MMKALYPEKSQFCKVTVPSPNASNDSASNNKILKLPSLSHKLAKITLKSANVHYLV